MDPIFTLPYYEFAFAQQIQSLLPRTQGYSVYAPLSRQEKGVDLIVTRRDAKGTRTATIQVKASRTYSPRKPSKDANARDYLFHTWFNRFDVPPEADFFALVAVYPADVARSSRARSSWWATVTLLFTQREMITFMQSILTVRSGSPDKMFGFGFDEHDAIFQTRGDRKRGHRDYSSFLLARRASGLRHFLGTGRRP